MRGVPIHTQYTVERSACKTRTLVSGRVSPGIDAGGRRPRAGSVHESPAHSGGSEGRWGDAPPPVATKTAGNIDHDHKGNLSQSGGNPACPRTMPGPVGNVAIKSLNRVPQVERGLTTRMKCWVIAAVV